MKANFRKTWLLVFFFAWGVIQVRAGIETYTDLIRMNLNGQDVMVGVVTATTDYSTAFYYEGSIHAELAKIEDGNEIAVAHGYAWSQYTSYFQAEAILPYAASGDYSVEGDHQLEIVYSQEYGGYYDPFDYSYYHDQYLAGFPAWHPLSYSFLGGPYGSLTIPTPSLVLGLIYAYREAAAQNKSSSPHHLKVDKDKTVSAGCGTNVKREITYVIVDAAGKNAGRKVIHRERFDSFQDVTCFQSGELPEPTTCSSGVLGTQVFHTAENPFTDNLTAGCRYSDPNCGFKVDKQRHYWCTHIGPGPVYTETPIAKMVTEARTKEVKVDNQLSWPKGTEFFP